MPGLESSLRQTRTAAGLSQQALARAAGISRQAYAAVESGIATPSTEVALRLARVLDATVESLFTLPEARGARVQAELASGLELLDETPVRVQLYRVGEMWLARPLRGGMPGAAIHHSLRPAHGLAHRLPQTGESSVRVDRVDVEVWGEEARHARSLVAVGCDPAMGLVASYLQGRGVEVMWFEQGSQGALEQLAAGQAHVAGCHLLDEATGLYNLPWVQRALPFPATVVTFAVWREGLMVAPGNPKAVRGVQDLARPGVSMVNREVGSGSRGLLDRELRQWGVPAGQVAGYNVEAHSHLMVAEVVAMGMADVGVGVEAAAMAAGLEFIPLSHERYDLVIPNHFLGMEPVQLLLTALGRREVRQQVEALGGYDTAPMGVVATG